ncbi:thiamine phosphate phosphatase-like protein [Momordica charantia]|uniref:Thiamine phosphate phosphatase-like protein n=1 Tax=Momordica charantia TaxID=3673 RepID=A0A6J1D1B8_MOMCH|nr:thiamine phosphate phosphatase-like protein [Momordica charantia]
MAGITIVFDFDRTIIDGDSDNLVVTQMGLTNLFNELYSSLPWNSLMDRNLHFDTLMVELQSQERTIEDIAECLKGAALHPQIIAAIRSAEAVGCDLRIISDANQFFIETILKHHGVLGCFSKIYTNPTFVDGKGRLRILPFHDNSTSHGCNLCPSNMCKGLVIDQIRASKSVNHKFIYIGDGRGDFCPTLRLEEEDHVMPRKLYPLSERINSNQTLVKAKTHEWSDGKELEKILSGLVDVK